MFTTKKFTSFSNRTRENTGASAIIANINNLVRIISCPRKVLDRNIYDQSCANSHTIGSSAYRPKSCNFVQGYRAIICNHYGLCLRGADRKRWEENIVSKHCSAKTQNEEHKIAARVVSHARPERQNCFMLHNLQSDPQCVDLQPTAPNNARPEVVGKQCQDSVRYCNLIVSLLQKREKSWLPRERERAPPPRTHSGTTERTPANIRCAPHAVASSRRPNMVRRRAILLLPTNNSKNYFKNLVFTIYCYRKPLITAAQTTDYMNG